MPTINRFYTWKKLIFLSNLLVLALKFTRRVIVFFNEKKQCARALTLFAVFGLKAVQINGNMNQTDRVEALEKF